VEKVKALFHPSIWDISSLSLPKKIFPIVGIISDNPNPTLAVKYAVFT
jgi:hypothetical protein